MKFEFNKEYTNWSC